jgi:hypothetical protein
VPMSWLRAAVVPLFPPPPMLTMLCGFTLRHSLYHMYACLPLCYFLNINIFLSLFYSYKVAQKARNQFDWKGSANKRSINVVHQAPHTFPPSRSCH